ncbi:MAG: N-acetylmuramoyl-L-alanine amidase [Rhizobiaceae bacterium]
MSAAAETGFRPDFPAAVVRPSPNRGPRRGIAAPDMIVLHYTGMKSGQAAEERLRDPAAEVSSHYLVHEDGRVVQMVPERERAWHAGKSFWAGETDINSRSVGIEIVHPGHEFGYRAFRGRQIEAVITLCRDILGRHAIRPERVLAHSDVAPGRKIDPGEKFPWKRLAEAGVGLFVPPVRVGVPQGLAAGDEGEAVLALQEGLARYGYEIEASGRFDARTGIVVAAFQRHFRPRRVDGIADRSTVETLRRLLAALPDG